jgi:hypothetical protein
MHQMKIIFLILSGYEYFILLNNTLFFIFKIVR